MGQTHQFTATGTFSDGTTPDLSTTVSWTSSDATVATISSTGLATALVVGTTIITATGATGVIGNATLTVTPAPLVTIDTSIQGSAEELATLQGAVASILGEEVQVATERSMEIATIDEGLVVTLPTNGQTAGQQVTVDFNVTLGGLTLETAGGQGRATIHLGEGLSVESDARLEVTEAGIDVVMAEPKLKFVPQAPDAATLAGGSDEVAEVGVEFDVDLVNLPDGASLSVQYAKDASAFVETPGATFQLAARDVGGVLEYPVEDVAFVVNVTKSVITNQDLADNNITMAVSKTWYDQKQEQGKDIFITKIDDDGRIFTVAATCAVTGDVVRCTAKFAGIAGGFSVFSLIAVVPGPEPTPTATLVPGEPTPTPMEVLRVPTPTPTPTLAPEEPTATPTPTSLFTVTPTPPVTVTPTDTATPGGTLTPVPSPTATATPEAEAGGVSVGIIGGVVALLVAAGVAAYFLVLRRSRTSPEG